MSSLVRGSRDLSRWVSGTAWAVVALALLAGAGGARAAAAEPAEDVLATGLEGRFGGHLVVALRTEPTTFNPVVATDEPTLTVLRRMNADLIHIDRSTQEPVAALARSWEVSPDGRRFRLELRRGVRFSDGEPFDADDVVFTFRVYLDETVGSPNRDLLVVGGKPVTVRKLGSHTIEVELASPAAVGVRLFDSLAILPEHRLGAAYRAGRFDRTWGLGTPAGDVAGLGPFRLARHLPGERLELERNPHYWKVDREDRRLPFVDRLTFLFVASKEAQVLRFQSGETHLVDHLAAESFTHLEGAKGGFDLRDLGAGLAYHFLFFNLNDLSDRDPGPVAAKQIWFRQEAFRQAVSRAIDRDAIVRLVHRGRATPIATHVTPGNRLWLDATVTVPEHSSAAARELLREAGFVRFGERLLDGWGRPAELSLLVSATNDDLRRTATLIQEDLRQVGLEVRIVPMEFRALIDRVLGTLDYEACLLGLGAGDVDPNPDLNVFRSGGAQRFWSLGAGPPATPWETRLDELLDRQVSVLDRGERKRLYDEVQSLVAEHQPMVFLVSPNVLVGARSEVGGFRPAVLEHQTLWNAEELFLRR